MGRARPRIGAAFEVGAEPYQRVLEIVKQRRPGRVPGSLPRDYNIVDARNAEFWQQGADGFAQPPAGAVALDRIADFAAGCETHADCSRDSPSPGFHRQSRPPGPQALAHK